ncbi:MAG: pilus assembly protein PilM [Clostridia bacterium]|nr:pilus assembly protein PilM [Clostridia bacterium]
MPKKIGLEIGTKKTKIVVGNYRRGDFHIDAYKIIDTVDGVFSIDGEIDIIKMELPIKEALDEMKIKSGHLYVSINNERVIIRTRDLPRVSRKEMLDIVHFEADSFLPYAIDEFYLDYKVLNEVEQISGDSKKETLFNVMIIAAPKDLVKQYIQLADLLKHPIKLVSVYTEAINRYVNQYTLNENKNQLFVDIGASYTNMIMYQGKDYFANIKADIGITGIQDRLVENHGYTYQDVLLKLFGSKELEFGFSDNPKDKLSAYKATLSRENNDDSNKLHSLQQKLEKIKRLKNSMNAPESDFEQNRNVEYDAAVREISRMIEFFKSRKYGTFVDRIVVLGGGTQLRNFVEYLEDATDIETVLIKNQFECVDDVDFNLMMPSIGVCIGGRS